MVTGTIKDIYQNLPMLETSRLVLRKANAEDVSDIFVYASDAEVTRYLRWGPHQTISNTEKYVHEVLEQYSQGRDGPWVIELKDNHQVIGHIHLMEMEIQHQKAQVGFVLSKSYWNKGIMTEALRKVLEYSFIHLGMNRIEGWCIAKNRAAERVMGKSGMRKEGELREYLFQKDTFWDYCVYSMLQKEFDK
jgi:[ribosomal protein S5]-alanine N-acetyltransferase